MTEPIITDDNIETNKVKKEISTASWAEWSEKTARAGVDNWSAKPADTFSIADLSDYKDVVELSRFYYLHDPIAATVINKMIDIGVTDIEFYNGDLSDNELRLFTALAPALRKFLESCALELLLSGMVLPRVSYGRVDNDTIKEWGIKKTSNIVAPLDMWTMDSSTVKINSPGISNMESYFAQLPDDFIYFVQSGGKYRDGTGDPVLLDKLRTLYPEYIQAASNLKATTDGVYYVKLEDQLVVKMKDLAGSVYPIPYTYPVLESLKHKRNLRKMDYAIASRVISAIQLIKMGNDIYPLTQADEDQLDDIKQQMYWRNRSEDNIERIFQLFSNHTLEIEWVFPDVDALLDDTRYKDINQDILFGLGFPRILLTGESERTGTSDPEYAMISPVKTMESMRRKLEQIIERTMNDVLWYNNIKGKPVYEFAPMNVHDFLKFFEALNMLYTSGNLSREELAKALGFDITTELQKRKSENTQIKRLGIEEFAPVPHSNAPQGGNQTGGEGTPK